MKIGGEIGAVCQWRERNIVAVWSLQTIRGDFTLYKRTLVAYALYLNYRKSEIIDMLR